ncbi:MAG: ester cyclase [Sandaracinaceae bacterium]|nr:ester cyclase [Sandaracinaceae bacterium]
MDLKSTVRPFYDACLTVTPGADPGRVATILGELLADDFRSINAAETKTKAQLIGQVQFFWKLVPDLAWKIDEMLVDGQRVVVRSTATGSPRGEFMGLTLDGSRSFRIMTIDIHTVVEGRIREVHHLEEWATAIRQLKG